MGIVRRSAVELAYDVAYRNINAYQYIIMLVIIMLTRFRMFRCLDVMMLPTRYVTTDIFSRIRPRPASRFDPMPLLWFVGGMRKHAGSFLYRLRFRIPKVIYWLTRGSMTQVIRTSSMFYVRPHFLTLTIRYMAKIKVKTV